MRWRLPVVLLGLGWCAAVAGQSPEAELAGKALAVLKAHCYRCHGQDGVFEGGMNYVLDPVKLAARKKVAPGKPGESPLLVRIQKGAMPPAGEEPRPTPAEVELLKQWIAAGAPSGAAAVTRSPIEPAQVSRWILADLDAADRRARRFYRYFSLVHLHNQGLSDDELQSYRNALAKLTNSLSWHPKISLPHAIDAHKTVLRVDLRWFMWDATMWNRLLNDYPYGVFDDSATSRAIMVGTATKIPVLRADWFIANACRPPLYFDMLQLPNNLPELERQLRVDAAVNIQQERVVRLGFNGSGISKNNRILERHDSIHGVYWRTYDFDAVPQNLVERGQLLPDRRNIFAYPLGPFTTTGSDPFQHAGGEAIFSLPNGLHGFMLVNAAGIRIDKGPIAIVSDPKRPDRAVETGVSCMSCHLTGINPKSDQVREFVAKHPQAFKRGDAEIIRALYPPADVAKKLMDEDIEKYRKAVEATGARVIKTEVVSTLTLRYEADVDLATAAAEAGFSPEEFRRKIETSEALVRNLGALRVDGGTVSRQVFVQSYGDIVRDLKLGTLFANNTSGGALPDNTGDLDPLEGQGGQVNHAVFTRDGKFALFADADRSVRYFDVQAGRDLRRLVGHTASVWCVALSPDERRALSGSMDGSMRLWDVATGQELKRFEGHLSLVSAAAFSPDGKFALSAGFDGSVIYWDLDTGREARRFDALGKYIHALAFVPSGKAAFVAADQQVKLLRLEGGEVQILPGSPSAVTSVAVSADGQWAAAGNDRGEVRIWEKRGADWVSDAQHVLPAHPGSIRDVAFAPSGKALLTAGADRSLKLWDFATRTELAKFDKHGVGLVSARFVDDGKATLSVSRDGALKVWPLKKFEGLTAGSTNAPAAAPAYSPPPTLKPAHVIPIGGTIGNLTLSPNRKWLFLLNRTAGTLVQIDAAAQKVARELDLPESEMFALTNDGKTIATYVPDQARTWIVLIDAAPMTVRLRYRVDARPYDLAATDGGLVFATGDGGGWTDVAVIDTNKQTVAGRWGGFWNRSLIRLAPEQNRLYVSSQGVTPGKVEVVPIPAKLDEKPQTQAAGAGSLPLGGSFIITPDGQFLIQQTGAVLRLSANRSDDLKDGIQLAAHLSAAAAPEAKSLFLLAADGMTIKQYSYPELKWQKDRRLGVVATQIAFDVAANRLYAAVIDPQSFLTRSRARGHGDIHVYDLGSGGK